jgi:ABC-type Mn2+/Zn2+ transport system permease subunit
MTSDALVLSIAMAIAAGLVGCFAVMRRMALAGDALSHVALPGIGVALALQIHPIFGAAAMLFFGALLVWALEERARLATETTIGVVFSAALAIGSITTSGEDLIEALVGGAGELTWSEIVAVLATGVGSYLAAWLDRETGPLIVTAAAVCFLVSLLWRQS